VRINQESKISRLPFERKVSMTYKNPSRFN